jgi:hypothetical protein
MPRSSILSTSYFLQQEIASFLQKEDQLLLNCAIPRWSWIAANMEAKCVKGWNESNRGLWTMEWTDYLSMCEFISNLVNDQCWSLVFPNGDDNCHVHHVTFRLSSVLYCICAALTNRAAKSTEIGDLFSFALRLFEERLRDIRDTYRRPPPSSLPGFVEAREKNDARQVVQNRHRVFGFVKAFVVSKLGEKGQIAMRETMTIEFMEMMIRS